MKKLFIALLFTSQLFQSCSDKKKGTEESTDTNLITSEDASIYLLDSKWKNQDGKEIQLKDLKGKVVVFTMMFTSCKSSCPKLVADVQRIESNFNSAALEKINFVLCTIDPDYDTPERLKTYAVEHNLPLDHWTLLTSSNENVREISATLGVKYKKTSPIEFSHSNVITVFTKTGELFYQQEGIENEPETIVGKINFLIEGE
jgi:protein SCO1/2